jgi:hypothetical protein
VTGALPTKRLSMKTSAPGTSLLMVRLPRVGAAGAAAGASTGAGADSVSARRGSRLAVRADGPGTGVDGGGAAAGAAAGPARAEGCPDGSTSDEGDRRKKNAAAAVRTAAPAAMNKT